MKQQVLLSARDLRVHFNINKHILPSKRKVVKAVDGIDLAESAARDLRLAPRMDPQFAAVGQLRRSLWQIPAGALHAQQRHSRSRQYRRRAGFRAHHRLWLRPFRVSLQARPLPLDA